MHPALAPLAFIDGLGGPEMLLVFVLVLLLFGGQKLPEFARGLGKTMREFKKAAAGVEEEFKRALDEDERKQQQAALTAAPVQPALTAPADAPAPAPAPTPDPHQTYPQDDSYYDHDHYGEAGPEAPGATPPAAGSEADKAKNAPAPVASAAPASAPTPSPATENLASAPVTAPATEPAKPVPPTP